METLITISAIAIVILAIFTLASYMTYGGLIGDKYLDDFKEASKDVQYNHLNRKIMYFGKNVVSNQPLDLFSKFHIMYGGCRISRFSKTHRIINHAYKNRHLNK